MKKKYIMFIVTLLIGVIFSIFSVVKLNHTYANAGTNDEYLASTMVPFYWLILLIGGLILITLSYVSWRKYKGSQRNSKGKGRGSNN